MSQTVYVVRFTMQEDTDENAPFSGMVNGVELECDTKSGALDMAGQVQSIMQEVRNPSLEQPGRDWLRGRGLPSGFIVSYDGVHQIMSERIA